MLVAVERMNEGNMSDSDSSLDEIIDGIYLVAVEPARVDELVAAWRNRFKGAADSVAVNARMEMHLRRAVELLDRLNVEDAVGLAASHSQPVLRVDSTGSIVVCNASAARLYHVEQGDKVSALPVRDSSRRTLTEALARCRREQGQAEGGICLLRLTRSDNGEALMLRLARVAAPEGEALVDILGAEILCSDELRQVLTYTFELTATEAEIAAHLIEGMSVSEIAQVRDSSVGTVRVHVRSLLSKSETHNQAEFIRMAIGISSMLAGSGANGASQQIARKPDDDADPYPRANHRHILELPDGRHLAYADFGSAGEHVVLFMHDNILGDTWPATLARAAVERGLRVIAPARPYFSESSPYPTGQAPLEVVVRDTRYLLETLGVDQYVVMSRTTGSAFAAALAIADPDGCRALVALSPALPFQRSRDYDHLNDHARFVALSARFQKTALLFACRAGEAFYRTAGTRCYLRTVLARSMPDRRLCDNPRTMREFQHGCDYSNNYRSFYHELLGLQSHPFPYFERIACPVDLVVGELDSNNRRHQAERVSAGLDNFQVTVVAGAGALFYYSHGEIVLAALDRAFLSDRA